MSIIPAQKPKGGTAKDPALVKTGQSLFRGGVAATGLPACASCHSPNGAGIPRNYPRLAGQHADYAYAQLQAFKAGDRGADKDGKDAQGKIMAAIAQKMSDAQMKAVDGLRRRIALTALAARATALRLLQFGAHDRLVRTVAFGNPHRRLGAHLVANHDLRRVAMIDRGLVEKPPQRLSPFRAVPGDRG